MVVKAEEEEKVGFAMPCRDVDVIVGMTTSSWLRGRSSSLLPEGLCGALLFVVFCVGDDEGGLGYKAERAGSPRSNAILLLVGA